MAEDVQGLLIAHAGATKLARQDLLALPTPEATVTHRPVPHADLVEGIFEALTYRHIDVVSEEYAATADGMRLFGVLGLSVAAEEIRLAIAFRNSHDKSFALGMVAGFRVLCCDNLSLWGDFVAIAKKHSKHLDVVEAVALGIDRVQRKFQPIQHRVQVWKEHALPDIRAKEIIYDAFVSQTVDAPKHLMKGVHHHYFEPEYEEFKPRTLWSLKNAFTSAFKQLDPIPMYRATASLGTYFDAVN
jgi:hypothetical protein